MDQLFEIDQNGATFHSGSTHSILSAKTDEYGALVCMKMLMFNISVFSPEAMGVLCGAVYLICLFIFIPFPFWTTWWENGGNDFPHHKVILDVKYQKRGHFSY